MSQDIFVVIEHLQGNVADISYIMLAAAQDLSQWSGGEVVGVLLGKGAQELASDFAADRVLYIDHPALAEFTSDAYQKTITNLVSTEGPRAILFGNTSIGADVANAISINLNMPLVSSCIGFGSDGKFTSQICGGKIMAEGELPGPTAVITIIPGGHKPEEGQSQQSPAVTTIDPPELDDLRVKLLTYIEPETGDVDISREPILIAVGRGIQTEDNVELAEELADLIDGTVCASRPIVDQGWLATSRMVGKSGKSVKPKLYIALGISGAPEHVEGMIDSETIIAVNTDPAAPIFDIAKYGAQIDLLDLLEVLIEQLEEI